ncbi:hypothetical protein ANN_26118 [Periplaneta americana]|uniref:Uncharacterized protein n=1 Tax=Periplaneta americana TaxID=6978 RepID=A0ABQ8S513_PERAM|nr:hypothetical protein ANN_26118 [Periplaneta americana]
MAGLCEGGNEPPGSLKASNIIITLRGPPEAPGPLDTAMSSIPSHRACPDLPVRSQLQSKENPGKNLNQVTCPDRESNPGHLVSRPDALTVIPQAWTSQIKNTKAK